MTRTPMRFGLLAAMMLAPMWGACATPSPGCGKSLASGSYRMTDQNLARTYSVLVPARYRPRTAYPLVLAFHGWGGDENEFLGDKEVTRLADERGYILVVPRGLGSTGPDSNRNSWSFRGSTTGLDAAAGPICDVARTPDFTYPSCRRVARNTCSWTHCQADDVAFTVALVREIESRLCVDTARVYATGGSNGGMFVWELGQNAVSAPVFRAIAALIGLPHRGYLDAPGKAGGLPVLLITGTHDKTVPPGAWERTGYTTTSDGNAYYYTGATAIVRSWGAANSCPYAGKPAASFRTGVANADCRSYCSSSGQGWSGGAPGVGWPNVLDCRLAMGHDYDFAWSWKLTLDFFDAHSRPVSP